MFERSDLKTRAKLAMKRNYWGCVIAPVLSYKEAEDHF